MRQNTSYKIVLICFSFFSGFTLLACQHQVIHDQSQSERLGYWNAHDSKFLANKMISRLLEANWLKHYIKLHRKEPSLSIQTFNNKNSRQKDVDKFIADIEHVLLKSGDVNYIVSQQTDYRLTGTLNTLPSTTKNPTIVQYRVELQLIDSHDQSTAWRDSHVHVKRISSL